MWTFNAPVGLGGSTNSNDSVDFSEYLPDNTGEYRLWDFPEGEKGVACPWGEQPFICSILREACMKKKEIWSGCIYSLEETYWLFG